MVRARSVGVACLPWWGPPLRCHCLDEGHVQLIRSSDHQSPPGGYAEGTNKKNAAAMAVEGAMSRGRKIADGLVQTVRQDQQVLRAYAEV